MVDPGFIAKETVFFFQAFSARMNPGFTTLSCLQEIYMSYRLIDMFYDMSMLPNIFLIGLETTRT